MRMVCDLRSLRSPMGMWALAGLVSLACSLVSPVRGGEPTPAIAEPTSTGEVPSAADLIDQSIPSDIEGVVVGTASLTGDELDPSDPAVAALADLYGVDLGQVQIAVAFGRNESGGTVFHAEAVHVPGRDWAGMLEALGRVGNRGDGVLWEWAELGGRRVLQARASADPDLPPVSYTTAGDTLLVASFTDEEISEDYIGGLPETGDTEPAPPLELPPAGAGPLALVILRTPEQPVCVAEPPGRQRIVLLVLDAGLGLPVPYSIFTVTGQLMSNAFTPPPMGGPVIEIPYAADRYGGGLGERLVISAQALLGGFGQTVVPFAVQHCLQGTWQDGERVVRIGPPYSRSITAEVISGSICGEEGGVDFSGVLRGEELTGEDLKVCNPDECVDPELLPASVNVPFTGRVADDGMSITIDWTGDFYQFDEDSQGNVVACTTTSTEEHQFTITRLTFGE